MADIVFDQLAAIETNVAWAWILELDPEDVLEALDDWFRKQEIAPGTREHLALSAAVIAYWFRHRGSLAPV